MFDICDPLLIHPFAWTAIQDIVAIYLWTFCINLVVAPIALGNPVFDMTHCEW